MENALRQLTQALDRIAACNDRQAALVARNTLRRLKSGEAPITGLTEFARQRLELIALGQERKAARIAAQALQQAR